MFIRIVKYATRVGLIAIAFWNIQAYTRTVLTLPEREVNATVYWEKAWDPIHLELDRIGYRIGDLGYITSRSLRGEPMSEAEDIRRAALYFVVIPLNLLPNRMDTPFVLADFSKEKPPQLPPYLVQVYDPGNGLVLLRSIVKP